MWLFVIGRVGPGTTGRQRESESARHARKLADPQPARAATTGLSAEEAVSGARDLLQQALQAIDRELGAAKSLLEDAQARYEQLASCAAKRRQDLERKLKALDA